MTVGIYQLRPLFALAVQWDGTNEAEIISLVGSDVFAALDEPCSDDPAATAEIRDPDHGDWRLVYTGDWIIRRDDAKLIFRLNDDQFLASWRSFIPVLDRVAEVIGVPVADLKAGLDLCPHNVAAMFGYDNGLRAEESHLIEVREDGWTIQHPLACRPNLFACDVNGAGLSGPPDELGIYECAMRNGHLIIGKHVESVAP